MTETSALLKYLSDSNNYNIMDETEPPQRPKKRRLDHLSWEEKLQRKKLKNRVAAQTSRDRKKAKLEQMEKAIQELYQKNEKLTKECENLKSINERLSTENVELQNRISQPCQKCSQNRTVECETENGSTVSHLQPKGTATHSAAALAANPTITALVKILLVYLLYRTSSMNLTTMPSTLTHWTNSHKAYSKISPETWKLLLKDQLMKNKNLMEKWWGSHQNNWNPVEVKS